MLGWLVKNGFSNNSVFGGVYKLFLDSAEKRGIELQVKKTTELLTDGKNFLEETVLPDFVLFYDKDIALASEIEKMGVRVFNPSSAIEKCDNKILTALTLAQAGIPTPETVIVPMTYEGLGYTDLEFVSKIEEKLGYPFIIKEAFGSLGGQVYLTHSRNETLKIIEKIGHKRFLCQKFIESSQGRDIRVNVVGDRVVGCMLRENKNDFRSNIAGGGKGSVVEINDEQKKIAIDACKAMGNDFAGVDVLFGENGKPLICEVNSNPQFIEMIDCTGYILDYILSELG